jgi:SAM-dependent methyltransferase
MAQSPTHREPARNRRVPGAGTPADGREDTRIAERYFGSFADDYHRAFHGTGRDPLHALINRLFRQRTFARRTEIVRAWLGREPLAGKLVLDLGCGSGEVSLVAARMGATVTGLDIVPRMVELAREQAAREGLAHAATFQVGNVMEGPLPACDTALLIGVIEYYDDLDALLGRVAAAARERIIIVDTYGPWWRRLLRYGLARLKRFRIYYRAPEVVAGVLEEYGFREEQRELGHSFVAFSFRRHSREGVA